MTPRLVAGVDSSTQSCKVVIVDAATGALVREGRAPHPDGTEVDPGAWWVAFSAAIRKAGGLDDVTALSIGGQQHGLVALDAEGRVIRPALLWNDTRSAGAAADLVAELGAADWAARTGLVPVASFTVAKLRWLRDAEPEHARRVAAVALPHDWLSWRLRGYGPTGESPLGPDLDALATDGSDASGTGYWNPRIREYDAELFELAIGRPLRVAGTGDASGTSVVVPRVAEGSALLGSLATAVELPDGLVVPVGLRVAAGAGDNAAAALGLGLRSGDIAISLGTSGTVFGVATDLDDDVTGTVTGFADATGRRLPIVTTLNAARVLDLWAGVLEVGLDELGALALQGPPGAGGLVLVPYFVGERTPNLPDATAQLIGLTPTTMSRPHLARAAVEGMICGLAAGLAAIEAQRVDVRRVLLIGGAARNAAVQRVAAEIIGRDITVPRPGEYVAIGAARQAAMALAGEAVDWTIDVATVSADPRPEVLAQYQRAIRSRQGS